MDYYFSGGGILGVWRVANEEIARSGQCRLVSHAYPGQCNGWPQLLSELQPSVPVKTLLDSGAFSAWSKGDVVNREDLARQMEAMMACPYIDLRLVNLDKIPGRKGVDPTAAELREAMEESEANFAWLNARFPNRVLPVYHQGEPLAYLEQLARESAYICVSPRNDLHEHLRVDWSQKVHAKLAALGTKTHGLATTGFTMMRSVPWTSVDSATWGLHAGYGKIYVPAGVHSLRLVAISSESGSVKDMDEHYDTLPAFERDAIQALIDEHAYDTDRLRTSATYRSAWNVRIIAGLLASHTVHHVHQPGLFD